MPSRPVCLASVLPACLNTSLAVFARFVVFVMSLTNFASGPNSSAVLPAPVSSTSKGLSSIPAWLNSNCVSPVTNGNVLEAAPAVAARRELALANCLATVLPRAVFAITPAPAPPPMASRLGTCSPNALAA